MEILAEYILYMNFLQSAWENGAKFVLDALSPFQEGKA